MTTDSSSTERETTGSDFTLTGLTPADSSATDPPSAEPGQAPEPAVAPPTMSEIVADEVADIAVEDPERAAQFVAAVSPSSPTVTAVPPMSAPVIPLTVPSPAGPTVAQRAFPAAIVGVLVLDVLVKGRVKRLGLALAGSALVAAFVAGRQQ